MVQRSKKYREAAEKIDRNNLYTANEAIALLKSMPEYKFDQTVEAVLRLNVDPRKADQLVRGSVNLPNGTGKTAKVLVFARGPKATEALEAGADIVGDDDLVQKVADGFLDFDSVVATPDMMGKVGRLGRVLGPRGLMPNPKTGTVTMDVTKAIKDIKGGKVDFRARQERQPELPHRQDVLHRAGSGRELQGCGRRSQASEAVHREGPLRHQGDHHLHDEPGRPG